MLCTVVEWIYCIVYGIVYEHAWADIDVAKLTYIVCIVYIFRYIQSRCREAL